MIAKAPQSLYDQKEDSVFSITEFKIDVAVEQSRNEHGEVQEDGPVPTSLNGCIEDVHIEIANDGTPSALKRSQVY